MDIATDAVTRKVGMGEGSALSVERVSVTVISSGELDEDVGSWEFGLREFEHGDVAPNLEGGYQHAGSGSSLHIRRIVLYSTTNMKQNWDQP